MTDRFEWKDKGRVSGIPLRQSILRPFVTLIIVTALVVLLVFNIASRLYFHRLAMDELKQTNDSVLVFLKKELNAMKGDTQVSGAVSEARPVIMALNNSLRLTAKTSGSEVALIGARGNILIPRASEVSAEMVQIAESITSKLMTGKAMGVQRITANGQRFLVSFEALELQRVGIKQQYLIVATSQRLNDLMVQRINVFLIGILLLAALVATLIARRLADHITRPIVGVSKYAKGIASGDYRSPEVEAGSVEMEALYSDLHEMSLALSRKEQTKLDFLQNFSHDLRTPLMSIQGYAEGIVTGVFEDPQRPASIIASESLRLKYLVDQLLTLSRLDAPSQPVLNETIEIMPFLQELIQRFEGMAALEKKKIICQCQPDLLFVTDSQLLEKILSNLISNAVRYALETVIVSVSADGEGTGIKVSDDGPGIPVEFLPHVFDRFTKGKGGNFGLGLAIAHAASERIGGELTVENKHPGAVFELRIRKLAK